MTNYEVLINSCLINYVFIKSLSNYIFAGRSKPVGSDSLQEFLWKDGRTEGRKEGDRLVFQTISAVGEIELNYNIYGISYANNKTLVIPFAWFYHFLRFVMSRFLRLAVFRCLRYTDIDFVC